MLRGVGGLIASAGKALGAVEAVFDAIMGLAIKPLEPMMRKLQPLLEEFVVSSAVERSKKFGLAKAQATETDRRKPGSSMTGELIASGGNENACSRDKRSSSSQNRSMLISGNTEIPAQSESQRYPALSPRDNRHWLRRQMFQHRSLLPSSLKYRPAALRPAARWRR
jgi:hypothetical protein